MRRTELRHLPWIQRILLVWVIEAITFGVMITLIPSISFQAPGTALLTAAVVGLANALVQPLLARSRLTPSLRVFGIIALGLNVLIVWLASEFVRGAALGDIWLVLLVSTVLAFVNITFTDLFAIDDDDSYFHHLVSRIAVRPPPEEPQTKPGVLFLEIDGLSERVLQQAIQDGYMPTLAGSRRGLTVSQVGNVTFLPRPPPARPASCWETISTSRPSAGTKKPEARA